MLIGAIDPLEGSVFILGGVALVAAGAWLSQNRWRRLIFWAFVLAAIGIGTMFVLSAMGGIGGHTGRSLWWAVILLPYPIGWVLGVVGAILALTEEFRHVRSQSPVAS
jgi:hypothetical protein